MLWPSPVFVALLDAETFDGLKGLHENILYIMTTEYS